MGEIEIYQNIQKRAKEVGKSVNSIEKETGLARGSLCKWNTVSPSVRSLRKVADSLGCTIDSLVTNT